MFLIYALLKEMAMELQIMEQKKMVIRRKGRKEENEEEVAVVDRTV
jgi:hypothetical protein